MVFLDITWGETFVLTGLGFALIGRKDLPKAAHFLGAQVGRVVGFLQGVRVRADRFTEHHELRALHNELRSGLRELDAVRVELATAASSRGIVGRGLQSPVGVVQGTSLYSQQNQQQPVGLATLRAIQHIDPTPVDGEDPVLSQLTPRVQSVAAVAEAEWEKQGIGFRSKAEMGIASNSLLEDFGPNGDVGPSSSGRKRDRPGSMLLADVLQESLIFDQYDRTVREQDQILQKNIDIIAKQKEQGRA